MLEKSKAQVKIAVVWFIGFAVLFAILLYQTIVGKYSGKEQIIWGWFFPLTLPMLGLIITVLILQATRQAPDRLISKFLYRITMYASFFYLLIVFITLLSSSLTPGFEEDFLSRSGTWLGALQGIVAALMGVFFVREEPLPSSTPHL